MKIMRITIEIINIEFNKLSFNFFFAINTVFKSLGIAAVLTVHFIVDIVYWIYIVNT